MTVGIPVERNLLAPGKACEKCGEHQATCLWGGEKDSLTVARNPDVLPEWCDCCAAREQVAYIEKMAARLPMLRAKLANAKCTVVP